MGVLSDLSPFMQGYVIVLITIVGLIFGSFINVVALRLLSEESIIFPASKCVKCGTPIKWYDNIPLLGYLFLLGKCRSCKEKISPQYPIVEITTGLIFLGIFLTFGLGLKTIFLWILACLLIIMTITDIKEKVIFDAISIPIIPLGIIYNFFDIGNSGLGQKVITLSGIGTELVLNEVFIAAFIGALLGAFFFEALSGIGYLMVGQRAFGEGDSVIAMGLGAWFGWKYILIIIALSFLFQMIIGLPVLLNNMYKDKDFTSIKALGLMLLAVAIPCIGNLTGLSSTSLIGALSIILLSFALAGTGIYIILSRTRQRKNFTFLPFGPALVLGGFAVIFFGSQLLEYFSNIY